MKPTLSGVRAHMKQLDSGDGIHCNVLADLGFRTFGGS